MIKIEVLGTGCPKCQKTAKVIEGVLHETGIEAEIIKVQNVNDIVSRGVMVTPAVMVNGEVKCEGKVPSADEVRSWLK